jgi:hypothetical protein
MKSIRRPNVSVTAALISFAVLFGSVGVPRLSAQNLQAGSFSISPGDLLQVPPEAVPGMGTFWMLSDCEQFGEGAPPYPFNPYPQAAVYTFGVDGVFLVDDSSVDRTAPARSIVTPSDDQSDEDSGDGTNDPPPDMSCVYSNNLASVSQWLHTPMTNSDGTVGDFQSILDRMVMSFWGDLAGFSEEQAANVSNAWIQATNNGIPTVMCSESGATAVLADLDNGAPHYNADFNVESAQTISTPAVQPGGWIGLGLTGTNRNIFMWEGNKPRATHVEFGGRVTLMDSQTGWFDLHATEVAGCLAAAGVVPAAKGMSYEANVFAGCMIYDISKMVGAIQTNNMRLSNHSYGYLAGWYYDYYGGSGWLWEGNSEISTNDDPKFGLYSGYTSNYDAVSYSALQYLGVWAAGDSQSYGPPRQPTNHWETSLRGVAFQTNAYHPWNGALTGGYDTLSEQACAKNVLTVGAVYPLTNGYAGPSSVILAPFSSCGPTDDGRIKPDIVAAGVSIFTPYGTSDSNYVWMSGTSIAAPAVTGSINLLAQLYSQLHPNAPDLLGSTYKALVIQTADQCGTDFGPSYQFGWGLMDTAQAAGLLLQDATNGFKDSIKEVLLHDGTQIQFPLMSAGGAANPLKLTIVWTDPPGVGNAETNLNNPAIKLANDLDLRVIDAAGATNLPFVLNPDLTNRSPAIRALPATTGDNNRDNVEQVCITNPTAGTYVVSVTHKGTLQGGSQWVSILLSGNTPSEQSQQPLTINTFVQTATNSMAIGWPAVVGAKYQVQSVSSLDQSNDWQLVGGQISARLTNVVTQVPYDSSVPSMFYRVVQLP